MSMTEAYRFAHIFLVFFTIKYIQQAVPREEMWSHNMTVISKSNNKVCYKRTTLYFFSWFLYFLFQRWYESGGDTTKLMRPKIEDSNLPEEYNARTGLRKVKYGKSS